MAMNRANDDFKSYFNFGMANNVFAFSNIYVFDDLSTSLQDKPILYWYHQSVMELAVKLCKNTFYISLNCVEVLHQ